jgi:Zn-finger domain-containing protein
MCEKRDELLATANAILEKLHTVTDRQREVVAIDGISPAFLHLDKELELLMGEKERVVGALREHDEEHGCRPT